MLLVVMGVTVLSSILWVLLFYGIQDLAAWELRFHLQQYKEFFLKNLFISIYPFFVWSILYFGFKIYEQLIFQRQNALRAEILAQSAQLETLRYQINPHFLFNTLNSARTLVQINPSVAQKMLTQISEFLRYSLSESKKSVVPLEKEIEAIGTYLDIEKIRFNENLIVDFRIDDNVKNIEIPVFLILPLVENAIKHGMKTTILPLKISVMAKKEDRYLCIEIVNSGKWIDNKESNTKCNTGTGLKNVEKRLENSYPGCYHFHIKKEEEFVHVILKIKIN